MAPEQTLSSKQRTILDAILFLIRRGELPTVREVGALVGLRSPATVLKHLRGLEKAGFISLSGKSRGIRIADQELLAQALTDDPQGEVLQSHLPNALRLHAAPGPRLVTSGEESSIPLVGAIAAGQPFESYAEGFSNSELAEAYGESGGTAPSGTPGLGIDPQVFCQSGEVIALRIEGESMVNAGILDGDYAIIRRQSSVEEGEIAAVIIDGEGTLKRWTTRRTSRGDRQISLQPENDHFEPIELDAQDGHNVLVIGKYVGLVRGDIQLM